MKWALIVVDVQKDFCEGGQLAVSGTVSLLPALYSVVQQTRKVGVLVVFTQDWHPLDHHSFAVNGGRWPVHCVAGSPGAELETPLAIQPGDLVIRKGRNTSEEGYSAFESTELEQQLRSTEITALAISGMATDFCVRASALDAAKAGFETKLLVDLTRAVYPATMGQQLGEMEKAGIQIMQSRDWLRTLQGDK